MGPAGKRAGRTAKLSQGHSRKSPTGAKLPPPPLDRVEQSGFLLREKALRRLADQVDSNVSNNTASVNVTFSGEASADLSMSETGPANVLTALSITPFSRSAPPRCTTRGCLRGPLPQVFDPVRSRA